MIMNNNDNKHATSSTQNYGKMIRRVVTFRF